MKVTEKRFLNLHNSISPISPTGKSSSSANGVTANGKSDKLLMVSITNILASRKLKASPI